MDEKTTNPGVHYERKDIRFGCLLAVMIVAGCVVVSVGYGMWRFYWWQAGQQQAKGRSQYPLSPGLNPRLPPEPRLEQIDRLAGAGVSNVSKMLAEKEKVLNSYGPSEEKGFVHVPIQEAIKATAGKLPVRKPPPGRAVKDKGLTDAGESNSGRMFRGESK